ncbi:MAG: RHS repeat-associated core domain-containing protein, partial [Bryobacteraceae bacterium]
MLRPLKSDVDTKFTGQIRDTETQMDYFNARYFTNALGRFNSPDPANAGADPTDPQTWNAYAYVRNNPLALIDPTGMDDNGTDNSSPPTFSVTGTACSWWQVLCWFGGGGSGGESSGSGDEGLMWDSFPSGGQSGQQTTTTPPQMRESYLLPMSLLLTHSINSSTINCGGAARVLQGNAATIGKPGGFSGPSAGNINVTAKGAAVIPSQWGGKAALRSFLNKVSGVFPSVNYSFTGIVDVMGGAPPAGFPPNSNVQTDLMQLNPGKLILELPGAPRDFGT